MTQEASEVRLARASQKRIFHTLDGMRGIAAAVVVIWHSSAFFGGHIAPSGYLAVDLFFMMSGVVISLAYDDRLARGMSPWAFMQARLIRLYPLYILGTAIQIVGVAASLATHAVVQWTWPALGQASLAALFMVPTVPPAGIPPVFPLNMPAWSLFFELVINLVYALACGVLTGRVLAAVVVGGAAAVVILALTYGWINVGALWEAGVYTGGIVRVTFSFFAGVLLCRLHRSGRLPRLRFGNAWLLLLLAGAVLFVDPAPAWRPWFDIVAVLAFFPWLIAAALDTEPRRAVKLFTFLGLISYPLYVVHAPIGRVALRVTEKLEAKGLALPPPYAGFVLLAGLLLLAWLLDRYYDRPVRRLLTARFSRKPEPATGAQARRAPR